ncbi:MAG: NnrU family protein [Dongiaceae bacterium]
MTLLIVGLALFIGMHLVPSFSMARGGLTAKLGENRYKILFSLASAAGLVLMVIGYGQAPYSQVFQPSSTVHALLPVGMAVAFVLAAAAYAPGRIRRLVRHPMMAGVLIWAAMHLLASGDLASNILFGAFSLWAVFAILSAERRGKRLGDARAGLKADIVAALVGLIAFATVLHFHADLFGATPI